MSMDDATFHLHDTHAEFGIRGDGIPVACRRNESGQWDIVTSPAVIACAVMHHLPIESNRPC